MLVQPGKAEAVVKRRGSEDEDGQSTASSSSFMTANSVTSLPTLEEVWDNADDMGNEEHEVQSTASYETPLSGSSMPPLEEQSGDDTEIGLVAVMDGTPLRFTSFHFHALFWQRPQTYAATHIFCNPQEAPTAHQTIRLDPAS